MLLSRLFPSPIKNAVTSADVLKMIEAGGVSYSGMSITPESAMNTSAVYACVKVLSEDVGKLPCILYRRVTKDGHESRERATDHPLYRVVNTKPNQILTPINYREMITTSVALRGDGISYISRVGRGEIKELIPLHPDNVTIKLNSARERYYEYQPENGQQRTFKQDEILHVMGLTLNGWSGVSPIKHAKESIGLTLATERHGSKVFTNGARLGGILTTPARFKDPKTSDMVSKEFDSRTSGENAHKTIVLEEGMKWEKVSMTADDAQFLETRQFQVPEIARFWRMPLHKIGDLTHATFTNIEHQALEYVIDTLGPWLCRWEQAMNMALLSDVEQEEYYFEFLVDGLLRGDVKSRFEAYSRGILAGFLTRNECRKKENLPWIDGLDEPLTPVNMFVGSEGPQQSGSENNEELV